MGVARPITTNGMSDFVVSGTIVENSAEITILFDSGSANSFVSKRCVVDLSDLIFQTKDVLFRSFTGTFVANQKIDLTIRLKDFEFHSSFFCDVTCLNALPYDMVVGRDVLNMLGAKMILSDNICLSLEEEEPIDLHKDEIYLPKKSEFVVPNLDDCYPQVKHVLQSYIDVFSDTCGAVATEFEFDVQLSVTKPIRIPPRRIPIHYEEEIKRQMCELEERGIISKTTSPYSFPIVIAKKKSGDVRLCVDFRQLNKHTEKLTCDIPQFDEIRNRLNGSKIFSTLDLSQGYWHIPLTDAAKEKLCFSPGPSWGNWRFNVMPFGPKNSPGHFQRCMQKIFGHLDFVFCYIDDLLIYSRDLVEHCEHLETVFELIRKHNLHVKFSKCKFAQPEVEYLGHVLKHNSYTFGGKVHHVLRDYPLPSTFKELESFIGLINYYRKFVKDFASVTKPLFDLKSQSDKNTDVKWTPDLIDTFNQISQLIINATPLAIPNPSLKFELETDASDYAVGATLIQNGKPIHYASRLLKKAEIRYSTYEKELLAIIFAFKQYYDCLVGKKFLLKCDHRPLIWIKDQKIKGRIGRWILTLQEFEFDIQHIAGNRNSVADALSRPANVIVPDTKKFDWLNLQRNSLQDIPSRYSKNFVVCDGLTKFKNRIVVPHSSTVDLCKHVHGLLGHPGAVRMIQYIKDRYFWPRFYGEIKSFVKNCETCNHSKSYSNFRNQEFEFVGKFPFEKVAIDLKGPVHEARGGYKYILVVKDTFSKFCCFYALRHKGAEEVFQKVLEFFCVFGKPINILSDGGLEFSQLKQFCEKNNVIYTSSSAFHHGNGAVERTIRWLEEKLVQNSSQWPEHLPYWQLLNNFLISNSTGLSPNEIVFSYLPRHLHDLDYSDDSIDCRPRTLKKLAVNDHVLVKNSLRKKGQSYYLKDVFKVIDIKGQSIKVQSTSSNKVLQRHLTFVKKLVAPEGKL